VALKLASTTPESYTASPRKEIIPSFQEFSLFLFNGDSYNRKENERRNNPSFPSLPQYKHTTATKQ